jgi:DNA-binding PadR family transcriptional regulator
MSLSRLAILGALMERPMHGYELKQYFEACEGVFWMINYGSIYPALSKLRNEGLIIGKKEPSTTVDRIVYTITQEGRDEFKNILKRRMERQPTVRDEFTMHLFFLDHLDKKVSKDFLLEKKRGNEALLADLKERESPLRKEMPKFRFGAVERGIMHIATEISWLNKILKEV